MSYERWDSAEGYRHTLGTQMRNEIGGDPTGMIVDGITVLNWRLPVTAESFNETGYLNADESIAVANLREEANDVHKKLVAEVAKRLTMSEATDSHSAQLIEEVDECIRLWEDGVEMRMEAKVADDDFEKLLREWHHIHEAINDIHDAAYERALGQAVQEADCKR
jgi:hypothetical protein